MILVIHSLSDILPEDRVKKIHKIKMMRNVPESKDFSYLDVTSCHPSVGLIQSASEMLTYKWYTLPILSTSQFLPLNADKLVRHYSFMDPLPFANARSLRDLTMVLLLRIMRKG